MDRTALEALMNAIPFNRHLGMRLTAHAVGEVTLEVPFVAHLVGDPTRPALHGGVLSALADTTGGMAVWSGVEDETTRVATIDLRVDYLRPARLVDLRCAAKVVRQGNRVGVADMRLFHPDREDETVATGKGVYNIVVRRG